MSDPILEERLLADAIETQEALEDEWDRDDREKEYEEREWA